MAETIWLFLGLLAVLTVASTVATVLNWKSTRKGDAAPLDAGQSELAHQGMVDHGRRHLPLPSCSARAA